MNEIGFLVGSVILYAVVGSRLGWKIVSIAALLLSVTVFPRRLFELIPSIAPHSGIATGGIVVVSVTVAVIACMITFRRSPGTRRLPSLHVVLVVLLIVMLLAGWEISRERVSGIQHIITGILTAVVGARAAIWVSQDVKRGRQFSQVLLLIVGLQGTIGLLQIIGLRGVGTMVTGGETISRVSGTLGHPGTLGKTMFFVLVLALPFARSVDRVTRRCAWTAITGSLILTGLTLGRANMVSVVLLLLVWSVLSPGRKISARLALPIFTFLAILPFVNTLLLRMEFDPTGGVRPALVPAALEQISRTPWFGIGPNSYVSVVSQIDPNTQVGVPVHNSFLLMVAEIGFVGTFLLLAPILMLFIRAVPRLRARGEYAQSSAVLLSALPGIVVVGMTGWGLFANAIFPLLFFTCTFVAGLTFQKISTPKRARPHRRIGQLA